MKQLSLLLFYLIAIFITNAQIGYQVSLLNSATGEPRANETVTVQVSITNNAGTVIYSGAQQATTNDFGVLSLSVGNANTFSNVDWSKLPFFISATVGGQLIGRTQILSVPIAEAARNLVNISPALISGRWVLWDTEYLTIYPNYTFNYSIPLDDVNFNGNYQIVGNMIQCFGPEGKFIIGYFYNGKVYWHAEVY